MRALSLLLLLSVPVTARADLRDDLARLDARRAAAARVQRAGDALLTVGALGLAGGAIAGVSAVTLAFEGFGCAVGNVFSTTPTPCRTSGSPDAAAGAAIGLLAIGAPSLVAGITMHVVGTHRLRRLREQASERRGREILRLQGASVAPVLDGGALRGLTASVRVRF